MKQGQIFNAFGVIEMLRKHDYASDEAYDLFKLRQKMAPIVQFQQEERAKLLEKYPPKKAEGGSIEFNTREDADAYVQEMNDLCNLEVDEEIEPITMTLRKDIKMYPDDFMVLDGLINFRKEEAISPDDIQVSMVPVESIPEE